MGRNIRRISWIALCAIGVAQVAHARTEQLTWSQPEADLIAGFELFWGTSSGSHPNRVDLGLPPESSQGEFSSGVELPDETVYVVVRARGREGYLSAPSNEKRLDVPTTDPSGDVALSQGFDGATLGITVPGWYDTAAFDSLTQDDSLFEVMDLGGNRVMGTGYELLNIHSHLIDGAGWSNYEFRGRMQVDDPSGSVGVTAYSAFPEEDVYYKLFRIGTNADSGFWIVGHPAIACDQNHTGVTPIAGAWYRYRLEVSSSSTANRIRARVWREGTSEPTTWQATCVDESPGRPVVGTVGVWSRGPGAKFWDDLEVVPVPAFDGSGGGGTDDGGTGSLTAPGRPYLVP